MYACMRPLTRGQRRVVAEADGGGGDDRVVEEVDEHLLVAFVVSSFWRRCLKGEVVLQALRRYSDHENRYPLACDPKLSELNGPMIGLGLRVGGMFICSASHHQVY